MIGGPRVYHFNLLTLAILLVSLQIIPLTQSFTLLPSSSRKMTSKSTSMKSSNEDNIPCSSIHANVHPSMLPGDPSLSLTTNLDLGEKKLEIMKACSKAIAARTGKPESYVGVTIADNVSLIFGGSDEPAALGCVYSIGSISMESNGGIQKDVTELLEPFGLDAKRIYLNFFDMPRQNVGWDKRTFAG